MIVKNRGWVNVIELSLIALFAVWIGRDYLNLDPKTVPFGREFGMVVQSHNFWNIVRECGWCALWNGSADGGFPALVEVFGAPFHPLITVTTLVWGVFNGVKVAILVSLWVAGFAQWWIARELRVGWLPRIWSALTAVAGGHLAGKMEGGLFTILMSTAFASLVIPAMLSVSRRRDRRAVVLLAVVIASAILGGQGYMQVGILATIPALLIILLDRKLKLRPVWKKYVVAGGIAVLLTAPLILSVLRFSPKFGKFTDPEFSSTQPIEYLPLNLVITDLDYYRHQTVLEKLPAPAPYNLYIGWVAVILAVIGVGLAKEDKPRVYFLAASIFLVFLTASGIILKWIMKIIPDVAAVRFPSFIAGYSVPMILGLAAYGLHLLFNLDWPRLMLRISNTTQSLTRGVPLKWVLLIPLVINLKGMSSFTRTWLTTVELGGDVTWIIETFKTTDLQWVSTPFGEHYFISPAITSGLKVSPSLKPWGWKDRELPQARLVALRGMLDDEGASLVADSFGIFVYLFDAANYASVVEEDGMHPCRASGSGGRIHVNCDNQRSGRLVVKENKISGWKAWRDDEPVQLFGDLWLEVDAPAGTHTYRFEYLPWDVPLGIVLSILGVVVCAWFWFRPSRGLYSSRTEQVHSETRSAEGLSSKEQ
jgi:hypothetical protein